MGVGQTGCHKSGDFPSLWGSAFSTSSDSFVEPSGNLKALLRPPRLPRARTALAGSSPLPRARPYLQPLRQKTVALPAEDPGSEPQRMFSPAPPPPHRPRFLSTRSRYSERESANPVQGWENRFRAGRSQSPELAAPLDPARPGPAPNSLAPPRRRHRKGPKSLAGRAGAA